MKRKPSVKLLQDFLNMYCIDGVIKVHAEARLFIKFLYENKIYNKFLYNFLYVKIKTNRSLDICANPESYIGYAFPWHLTNEGKFFWSNMDSRWRATLEQHYMGYLIYAC